MNTNLVNKLGEIGQDNLIAKLSPAAETMGIKIASGSGELARGTLLGRNASGKYEPYGVITAKDQKFNGDGSGKTFTVSDRPATLTSVKVGTTAKTEGTDFTYEASTGVITFGTAPAAGTNNVVAEYNVCSADDLTISCILADDADASTADATAVAYRSGNFNPAAVILPTGYTLTDADLDALRRFDIIFTQML